MCSECCDLIPKPVTQIDQENFKWLFKSIVRPHLEYANTIWNPARKKDITSIENVQRRATKIIPQLKDMNYADRLKQLKMPTSRYRRIRGDIIESFKIIREIYDPRAIPTLFPENPDTGTRVYEITNQIKTELIHGANCQSLEQPPQPRCTSTNQA